jgi:DNA-binding transcriptional ArsR family regulator
MAERPPRISDPQRIRALTHPLRLELIDLLGEGPATATQCAALTGESVASCSFHLRMLEKYGYIERDEQRGREKPWRLTSPGQDIRPDEDDPDSIRAVEAMAELYVEHSVEHIRRWLARFDQEPPAWNNAATVTGSSFWATQDELAELTRSIQGLADAFEGRSADPSKRPPGARPVRLFAAAHVDVGREQRAARSRA